MADLIRFLALVVTSALPSEAMYCMPEPMTATTTAIPTPTERKRRMATARSSIGLSPFGPASPTQPKLNLV